jgi:hypothetical protein
MSTTLTFANTAQARIYGSLAGALGHLGAQTTDWDGVAADQELWRLLVRATNYLDKLPWASDYRTFAARDALDLADGTVGDTAFPFRAACYELANLALEDEDVLTAADQGSNIQNMGAGGASITFFSQTSATRGTAPLLPPTVMKLIGAYLDISATDINAEGGDSDTGSCANPFGPCRDFDRTGPW